MSILEAQAKSKIQPPPKKQQQKKQKQQKVFSGLETEGMFL